MVLVVVVSFLTITILTYVVLILADLEYIYKVITHLVVTSHPTTEMITYVVKEYCLHEMVHIAYPAVVAQHLIWKHKYAVEV